MDEWEAAALNVLRQGRKVLSVPLLCPSSWRPASQRLGPAFVSLGTSSLLRWPRLLLLQAPHRPPPPTSAQARSPPRRCPRRAPTRAAPLLGTPVFTATCRAVSPEGAETQLNVGLGFCSLQKDSRSYQTAPQRRVGAHHRNCGPPGPWCPGRCPAGPQAEAGLRSFACQVGCRLAVSVQCHGAGTGHHQEPDPQMARW